MPSVNNRYGTHLTFKTKCTDEVKFKCVIPSDGMKLEHSLPDPWKETTAGASKLQNVTDLAD